MKRQFFRANTFWLVLSLALCLISAVGASIVQTSGGAVKEKYISWTTELRASRWLICG